MWLSHRGRTESHVSQLWPSQDPEKRAPQGWTCSEIGNLSVLCLVERQCPSRNLGSESIRSECNIPAVIAQILFWGLFWSETDFLAAWHYFQMKFTTSKSFPQTSCWIQSYAGFIYYCLDGNFRDEGPAVSLLKGWSRRRGHNSFPISNTDLQKPLTSHFRLIYLKWSPAERASALCMYPSKALITHSSSSCQSHLKFLSKNIS